MSPLRLVVQLFRLGQVRPDRPDCRDEPDRLAYYNTYEARMFFSHIVNRVAHGEEIVIARSGVPTAKLVPYRGERIRQGLIKLHVRVARDRKRDGELVTPTRSSPAASTSRRARHG